ncbi:MAG TPA: alpha/beta hydrolase [Alphaproteobacteria bacterium]
MSLEERFLAPKDWAWGQVVPRDGQYLRYGWAAPQNPKALVFVFPGLSEYIEKYFEVARDLMTRGFAVAIVDWRGHGGSWRHTSNPDLRHHDSFDLDVEDAFALIDTMSANSALAKLPKILLAHSMGAHIGLRVLHDRPNLFDCAVMNAPLQGIVMPLDGTFAQWLLAKFLNAIIGLKSTGGPWSEEKFIANLDILTSDPVRRAAKIQTMRDYPKLRSGSVSYGWVYAAIDSIRRTNRPAYLKSITTPILITLAGIEKVVSNAATRRLTAHLPKVEIVEISGALHEVLMERDQFRDQFWHAFDGFVAKHLKAL